MAKEPPAVPDDDALPPPPAIAVAVTRDDTATARATGGFLNVRRVELVATYPDGTRSAPFRYDMATRAALDAVVLVAHYREAGARWVLFRSAVRPPIAMREIPPAHGAALWELPAGLIEPGEAPAHAAARELREELGVDVAPGALVELGPWGFPVPAMCGERHVYYQVEIDHRARGVPTEDGSALERHATILPLRLDRALDLCRRGVLRDLKTELALRRLAEVAPP